MKYISLLLPLLLLACQPKPDHQWNSKSYAVVLTYDDGLDEHLDHVIPLLDSLNIKATFYNPTDADGFKNRLAEWKIAAANGHELGNHTIYHPCAGKSKRRIWVEPEQDLDYYTIPKLLREIKLSTEQLYQLDQQSERTFAYTCGDTMVKDSSFVPFIKQDFPAARGVRKGYNDFKNMDLFDIKAFGVNNQSAEELIQIVEKAKSKKSLAVFLFHGVGGKHPLNLDPAEHDKFIAYLKAHESEMYLNTMLEISNFIKMQRN